MKQKKSDPISPKGSNRVIEYFKRGYVRFLQLRGEPREIALGLALGVFVGLTPTLGFQMIPAILLAALFKCSKVSAGLGVWITNPLTAPVIYPATYLVGSFFVKAKGMHYVPGEVEHRTLSYFLHKAPEVFLALVIGGVIIGLPLAVISYYVSYRAILGYRARIKEKLVAGKAQLVEKLEKKRERRKSRRNIKASGRRRRRRG